MEMRDILKQLRENNHLTQEQMAERLMVTRQAVSRWENGETQPVRSLPFPVEALAVNIYIIRPLINVF